MMRRSDFVNWINQRLSVLFAIHSTANKSFRRPDYQRCQYPVCLGSFCIVVAHYDLEIFLDIRLSDSIIYMCVCAHIQTQADTVPDHL